LAHARIGRIGTDWKEKSDIILPNPRRDRPLPSIQFKRSGEVVRSIASIAPIKRDERIAARIVPRGDLFRSDVRESLGQLRFRSLLRGDISARSSSSWNVPFKSNPACLDSNPTYLGEIIPLSRRVA